MTSLDLSWATTPIGYTAPEPAPSLGRAYCPACRRRVEIADEFTTSRYDAGSEYEHHVTLLECGHHRSTRPVDVGPGPGSPVGTVPGSIPTARDARRTP